MLVVSRHVSTPLLAASATITLVSPDGAPITTSVDQNESPAFTSGANFLIPRPGACVQATATDGVLDIYRLVLDFLFVSG